MLRGAGNGRASMLVERIHIGAPRGEPSRQIGMAAPDRGGETTIDVAGELDQKPCDRLALLQGGEERRNVLVVARIMIGAGREQHLDHGRMAA